MFNLFRNKEKELEKEREQLMHDLENGGIQNLIENMGCREPYSELIIEQQRKGHHSNTDNISHYAFKVSSRLNNPAYKSELLNLLELPDYIGYRKYIFCCLASLCTNTSDYALFDFLLQHIEFEEDEQIIVSILSRLDDIVKPSNINISILKTMLVEGSENIRTAAARALSNCQHDDVEDLLLDEFKVSDKSLKSTICGTLKSVGTKKSIPVLQAAYKQTRDGYFRHNIDYVIAEIMERTANQ